MRSTAARISLKKTLDLCREDGNKRSARKPSHLPVDGERVNDDGSAALGRHIAQSLYQNQVDDRLVVTKAGVDRHINVISVYWDLRWDAAVERRNGLMSLNLIAHLSQGLKDTSNFESECCMQMLRSRVGLSSLLRESFHVRF